MNLSQKCQYGLRAIFDLAQRQGAGPIHIADIAARQSIPVRFLEQILGGLKRGGFVRSRRGAHGGYQLAVAPASLTVGSVIRFLDGPLTPVALITSDAGDDCPVLGSCAFMGMYSRVRDAVDAVYEGTTFQDLADEQATLDGRGGSYCI